MYLVSRTWWFIGLCLLFSLRGLAQDPYISQYTQMASVYNPAMTGMGDFVFKAGLLYQDHLNFSNSTIRKGVLNAEYGRDIHLKNQVVDRLGIGGGVIYDDYNLGAFFNNSFYVNVAYLKSLSFDNRHKLGLGLQFQFANRTIDYTRLTFGAQFLNGYYDKTIDPRENMGTRSANYFDMQAGLTYHYSHRFFNLKVGVAAFHLTQPSSKSINNFSIPLTPIAFASYETWFNNGKHLYVDVYYRDKSLSIGYFGLLTKYTAIDFGTYSRDLQKMYLVLGFNLNSNLLFSPYIGWKSSFLDAGLTFDLKVSDVQYVAYPLESFLEFFIAYKLTSKSKGEQAIGAGGYDYGEY